MILNFLIFLLSFIFQTKTLGNVNTNLPVPTRQYQDSNEVQFAEEYEYYNISGNTENALVEQMQTLGPEDYDGRVYAYAAWNINWDYPFKKESDRCILYQPITVDVKVKYTLPKWSPPDDAPPTLINKWNNYINILTKHEYGHKDIALKNAKNVLADFQNLKSFQTCDMFLTELDKAGFKHIDQAHTDDKDYDLETEHGRTQGAIFP